MRFILVRLKSRTMIYTYQTYFLQPYLMGTSRSNDAKHALEILQKLSPEMKFQNPPLGGAFEIPRKSKRGCGFRNSKGPLRPFRWLDFGVLMKEIWYFNCLLTSHHMMSKKHDQHAKFLSGIIVKWVLNSCKRNMAFQLSLDKLSHHVQETPTCQFLIRFFNKSLKWLL